LKSHHINIFKPLANHFQPLLNIYRTTIERLSDHYWTTIERLLNHIKHLRFLTTEK